MKQPNDNFEFSEEMDNEPFSTIRYHGHDIDLNDMEDVSMINDRFDPFNNNEDDDTHELNFGD